jgi:hypothetical protein
MDCPHLDLPRRVCLLTARIVGWETGVGESVCAACRALVGVSRETYTRVRVQHLLEARVAGGALSPEAAAKIMCNVNEITLSW